MVVAAVAGCFAPALPSGVAFPDTSPCCRWFRDPASPAVACVPHRLASGVAPNCVLQRHTRRTVSGLRPNRPGETISDSPESHPYRIGAL